MPHTFMETSWAETKLLIFPQAEQIVSISPFLACMCVLLQTLGGILCPPSPWTGPVIYFDQSNMAGVMF